MTEFQLGIILGYIRVHGSFHELANFLKETGLIQFNTEKDPDQTELYIIGFVNNMEFFDQIKIFDDPGVRISRYARTFIEHRGDASFISALNYWAEIHPEHVDRIVECFRAGIGYTYPSDLEFIIKVGLEKRKHEKDI
jgi:hypothetical protein